MNKNIAIIGSGAWGTAIANVVAINDYNSKLFTNHQEIADEINFFSKNSRFLPDILLNKNLKSTANLSEILSYELAFIAVPSNAVDELISDLLALNFLPKKIIIATKGMDEKSLKFFHEIFADKFGCKIAILSGPNFASEVATGCATVSTVASQDKNFADEIIKILNNDFFKAKFSDDVYACEISAIVKNIIAIACGMSDGFGFLQNTKAAIVVNGIDEISAICKKFNSPANLNMAAGFGDIFLTCSSEKSRNYSLGKKIAKGLKYREIKDSQTFEGANSAILIDKLAKILKIELKLCSFVAFLLQNDMNLEEMREKLTKIN